MPSVTVATIGAIGGNLEGLMIDDNGHGTMLDAGINRLETRIGSHGLGLLGSCRGGDVPIVGRAAHESVAHATAYDKGLKASSFERFQNLESRLWNVQT